MEMEWLENWECADCKNKFLVPESGFGLQIEGIHSSPVYCPYCGSEAIALLEDFENAEAEYITEDADGVEMDKVEFESLEDMMNWIKELGSEEEDEDEDESF
jgi:DNA-directed RNA polymerase subunit RPC12/RpoP